MCIFGSFGVILKNEELQKLGSKGASDIYARDQKFTHNST